MLDEIRKPFLNTRYPRNFNKNVCSNLTINGMADSSSETRKIFRNAEKTTSFHERYGFVKIFDFVKW